MQQTESENGLKKTIQLQRMYIEIILCILLIQNFMIRNSLATSIVKELNPSHRKKFPAKNNKKNSYQTTSRNNIAVHSFDLQLMVVKFINGFFISRV